MNQFYAKLHNILKPMYKEKMHSNIGLDALEYWINIAEYKKTFNIILDSTLQLIF